jgi:hypothetical protein
MFQSVDGHCDFPFFPVLDTDWKIRDGSSIVGIEDFANGFGEFLTSEVFYFSNFVMT